MCFCCVQAQYVFIYDALSELVVCGETDILAANTRININYMKEYVTGEGVTGFQKQFPVTIECVFYLIHHMMINCHGNDYFSPSIYTALLQSCKVICYSFAVYLQILQRMSSQYQVSCIEAKAEYNGCKNRFPHKLPS